MDKKTGAILDRPGITELLRYARPGDTIVAVTLDRLGRNLRKCLNIVHDVCEQGIGIDTLKDPIPIDTSDDSAVAEFAATMLVYLRTWSGCSCANAAPTPEKLAS